MLIILGALDLNGWFAGIWLCVLFFVFPSFLLLSFFILFVVDNVLEKCKAWSVSIWRIQYLEYNLVSCSSWKPLLWSGHLTWKQDIHSSYSVFFINDFSPSDLISCQTIQLRQEYRGIDSHIHKVALCGNECRCKTFCHSLMVTVMKNSIVISCWNNMAQVQNLWSLY